MEHVSVAIRGRVPAAATLLAIRRVLVNRVNRCVLVRRPCGIRSEEVDHGGMSKNLACPKQLASCSNELDSGLSKLEANEAFPPC